MNIPRSLQTMIDIVMVQLRTEIQGKPSRKAFTVTEITALDPRTKELLTNEVYRWDSKHDTFSYSGHSHILERNMKTLGLEEEEIQKELHRRKVVLEWMARNNIRKYTDVATVIREYYLDPTRVYKKARLGVK